MDKYIRYTHPAALGYKPSTSYQLDDILATEGMERVKIFFTPVNFKWEDLDSPKVEEKKEIINKRNR